MGSGQRWAPRGSASGSKQSRCKNGRSAKAGSERPRLQVCPPPAPGPELGRFRENADLKVRAAACAVCGAFQLLLLRSAPRSPLPSVCARTPRPKNPAHSPAHTDGSQTETRCMGLGAKVQESSQTYCHRLTEWLRTEGILKTIELQSLLWAGCPHQLRLCRTPSYLALGTSRDGAPTALGSSASASPPFEWA